MFRSFENPRRRAFSSRSRCATRWAGWTFCTIGVSLGIGLNAGCSPSAPPPPISTQAAVIALLEAADPARSPASDVRRDELIAAGARSYRTMGCVICHAIDATPMTGPKLGRLYENPVELAFTSELDPTGTPVGDPVRHADPIWQDRDRAYLWRSIAHPGADVVAGYTGAQRMTHVGHLMDDEEVAGLIAYLESNTRPRKSYSTTE